MRIILAIAATALVVGGATAGLAKHKAAHHAAFQINSTSWTYREKGELMEQSIGPDGNFVVHSGAKHIDHGTAVLKNGKACFTSAMTKEGEICWTTKPVAIGAIMSTTSDKGRKLPVTRVKYTPPKM